MAQYVEIDHAIGMSGLRVVLTPGIPGPWSESAKGILYVKKIPYVKVRQIVGEENEPLRRWTAQETAPAFVYNEERPRSLWNDQLYLVERLAPVSGRSGRRCAARRYQRRGHRLLRHAALRASSEPRIARGADGPRGGRDRSGRSQR